MPIVPPPGLKKLSDEEFGKATYAVMEVIFARAERISFKVMIDTGGGGAEEESKQLSDLLVPVLRDWGTCLEISLYEEAVTHFLGREQSVLKKVGVLWDGNSIGT